MDKPYFFAGIYVDEHGIKQPVLLTRAQQYYLQREGRLDPSDCSGPYRWLPDEESCRIAAKARRDRAVRGLFQAAWRVVGLVR